MSEKHGRSDCWFDILIFPSLKESMVNINAKLVGEDKFEFEFFHVEVYVYARAGSLFFEERK